MTLSFMPQTRLISCCGIELFGAAGPVGFPSAAGRARPKELAPAETAGLAIHVEQPLGGEGEVRRVLGLDPLPVFDCGRDVAQAALEVALLQAGAHALAVRVQRRGQVPARVVGARMGGLESSQLAIEMR